MTTENTEYLARAILLQMVLGRTISPELAETTARSAIALAEAFSAEWQKHQEGK